MVKKILVPIAFSKYSKGILNYAADLATCTGAELIVANVINERNLEAVDKITSYGYKVDVEHYVETIKKERLEVLGTLLEKLSLPDDKVTYTFCIGDPTHELLKLVVDRNIDMVVMGVKSKDIRHIFTGSVAEKMFRKSPVTIVSYRGEDISSRLRRQFEKHRGKDE
ncbi:MAG: nucleotide-binding universal stress UspA family protein [Desulforhopalus sp.]|jgi:nucleotide-binding universal stress UspA family protein